MSLKLLSAASLAGTFVLAQLGVAQEAPPIPSTVGQPPAMIMARVGDSGEIKIRRTVFVPEQRIEVKKVAVTEFRTEVVGGRNVARPVVVEKEVSVATMHYAEVIQESSHPKEHYLVRDLEGQKVEGESLAKALAEDTRTLLVQGEKELAPFYAEFFKKGTLVVYLNAPAEKEARPAAVLAPALDPFAPRGEIKAVPVPLPAVPLPAAPAPVPLPAPPRAPK